MKYVPITGPDGVPRKALAAVDLDDDRVCIARVGDNYYVFSDACPHAACPLSEGTLEGSILSCNCHGSEFDVSTGRVLSEPAEQSLLRYPVRIVNGRLEIDVEGATRSPL